MFTFCTQRLRFSEHEAYGRIEAARAGRKFPLVFDLLANGSVTLTTICLLAPHLTEENHQRLLAASTHQSKREVEQLIAALRPLPPVPSVVRKLPTPTVVPRSTSSARQGDAVAVTVMPPTGETLTPHQSASLDRTVSGVVRPLAPERYKVQLTITSETRTTSCARCRTCCDTSCPAATLLSSSIAQSRSCFAIWNDRSSRAWIGRAPESRQRHTAGMPAGVRRAVWERDGGRCGFVGTDGRCQERGFLDSPPRRSVCARWRDQCRQPGAQVPRAQRVRREDGIRGDARPRVTDAQPLVRTELRRPINSGSTSLALVEAKFGSKHGSSAPSTGPGSSRKASAMSPEPRGLPFIRLHAVGKSHMQRRSPWA